MNDQEKLEMARAKFKEAADWAEANGMKSEFAVYAPSPTVQTEE